MEKHKNTFTIGDVIKHKKWNSIGTIKSFRKLEQYILITIDWNIENNVGDDSEASLKDIEHYIPEPIKPVLFTTHDGVDITENDSFYWFRKTNGTDSEPIGKYEKYSGNPTQRSTTGNYLFFSSEEACKRHLELIRHNTINRGLGSKTDLITVQLTKEKYDLLMQLLEE